MQYFKIDAGKFIQFNETNNQAQIIVKDELQAQKNALQDRIRQHPRPSDAELLLWAKANYPYVDHEAEEAELATINAILDAIKSL